MTATESPSAGFSPVTIGPTWRKNDDGSWFLPKLTLGWHALAWAATWLQNSKTRGPWMYTPEQARFILHWYAINDDGSWAYRNGVLQRLKGWGKDPLAATMAAIELVGPSQFSGHFAGPNDRSGVPEGQPVGRPHPNAWVQIAAVSQDQTKNTMKLFPSLFTRECLEEYSIDLGKTVIYAHKGAQTIEAVTSSPRSLEGGRPTFLVANETHHWLANNDGHEMWDVFERNATKADSESGAARALAITNAYMPGEDSVAERTRDAMEKVWAGDAVDFGLMYDSLEAPPEAPLTPEAAPAVIEAIRGDSKWLNTDLIVKSILDGTNPPSRSRRFWYNQIVANEDSWIAPYEWDALQANDLELPEGTRIALFFDGSKNDDGTALMGCDIEHGNVFKLGYWQPPKGTPVDRDVVDAVVAQVHAKYKVVAFFGDPCPGEDETGERYWDRYIDGWSNRYGDKYLFYATQTGPRRHAVMWDMRTTQHQQEFTAAIERCYADVQEQAFKHQDDRKLRQHVLNAKRRPNDYGVAISKRHREAKEKIDLAVAMVGARMVRRIVLGSKEWQKLVNRATGKGRVIVLR